MMKNTLIRPVRMPKLLGVLFVTPVTNTATEKRAYIMLSVLERSIENRVERSSASSHRLMRTISELATPFVMYNQQAFPYAPAF